MSHVHVMDGSCGAPNSPKPPCMWSILLNLRSSASSPLFAERVRPYMPTVLVVLEGAAGWGFDYNIYALAFLSLFSFCEGSFS